MPATGRHALLPRVVRRNCITLLVVASPEKAGSGESVSSVAEPSRESAAAAKTIANPRPGAAAAGHQARTRPSAKVRGSSSCSTRPATTIVAQIAYWTARVRREK